MIDDSYNASPESTLAALDLLSEIPGRKTAVLGDMKELGQYERKGHTMVGEKAAAVCDQLIAVGPVAKIMVESALAKGMPADRIIWFENSAEAADYLTENPGDSDDVMLIKGSLSMNMALIVKKLEAKE